MIKLAASIWNALPSWLQHIALYWLNNKYVIGTNIILTDDLGRIWLQHHRFWSPYPWGLPGGHINYHETPHQAIIREIKEELSADIVIDQVIDVRPAYKTGMVIYFAGRLASPVGHIDKAEVVEGNFYSHHQLPSDIHPNHHQLIQDYIKQQEANHESKH